MRKNFLGKFNLRPLEKSRRGSLASKGATIMAGSDVTISANLRDNLLLLQRTQSNINDTQTKLATGLKVGSALDGPNEFFSARGLNQRAGDLSELKDAMGQAISTIQAADTGITSITSLVDQMRGITTSALGSLGDDAASVETRRNLADQFNTLKEQIDQLASDSGYQGKNLLVGNGLRIDSTSNSRTQVNTITGISNARTTNVSATDTYSIRISGDGAVSGNASDIIDAELERGLVGLNISGNLSSTLGGFGDVSIETRGSTGQLRSFVVSDGTESRVTQFFDNTQEATASLSTAATTAVAQTSNVAIDGTVEAGDVFSVTIEGVTFEYTAATTSPGATTDTAESIATKLAASIQSAIGTRLSSSTIASASTGSSGTIIVTGATNASSGSAVDFTINANAENAASVRISESFASGSVVSFTVDRSALESNTNGTSTIEKNVNIEVSVTNLSGEVVTRDGTNERGAEKLSTGENAFAFDTGTVRLTVDENTIRQASSAQAAQNLITTQQADPNTQNDITVTFNENRSNSITVESQNVTTGGMGLGIDFAQNDFLDRADIENAISGLDAADQTLRGASQTLSTNLNVITTRENFTEEFSNVLEEGANKLTLADQNEEGTKLLTLQTQQQLATISLSLANQQQQSILGLF